MPREPEPLDAVFHALADATRRGILERLRTGEATAGELAAPYDISAPAITKHLGVLEKAGLISRSKRAQWRVANFVPDSLNDATAWMLRQRSEWNARFDLLDAVIAAAKQKENEHA